MTPRRRPGSLLSRLRLVRGGDNGFALPSVLGLMIVAALIVTMVTAVTLNATGSSTSTRASVQAQASAEAGLARAQAAIASGDLQCSYAATDPAVVNYTVQVVFGAGVTNAPTNCSPLKGVVGSGSPESGTALVVSTGLAVQGGTQGNTSGDSRRLQAVMSYTAGAGGSPSSPATSAPATSTTPARATSPAFDRAVFIGLGGTSSSGSWTLQNSGGSAGGLYVNGGLTCAQINVQGPTLVYGSAALNGGNCVFGQGLTVTQNLTACTNTSITGTLTVGGNAGGACTVNGDAYVGGDFSCSSSVSGQLSVRGAITAGGWGCSSGRDLLVGGDLAQNYYTVSGALVSANGTISKDAAGSVGSLTLKTMPSESPGGLKVNGTQCDWGPTPKCTITTPGSGAAPPSSPVTVPTSPEAMPVVTAGSFGASSSWAAAVRTWYTSHGVNANDPNRFAAAGSTCTIYASQSSPNSSDGNSINGPVEAPVGGTVLDARSCSSLQFYGSTDFVLNGDLTLLVNGFQTSNKLNVVRGSSAPAGTTPALRIVVPMADGTTTCAANSSAGSISVAGSGIAAGSDVSVLLYSAGSTSIGIQDSVSFYGQMLSCKMSELKNSVTINYRNVGTGTSTNTSAATSSVGATQAAVFGGKSVSLRNLNHLYESRSGASDALTYAGTGGFSCANNTTIQGEVWSQGSASYANSCTSAGKRSASSSPPPSWTFPTLLSRQTSGTDPLDDWRRQGWTVKVFTGSNACSDAVAFLKQAQDGTTASGSAWRSSPLLVVVRGCSGPLSLDSDSGLVPGHTFTLYNDLALMSDSGVEDNGPLSIQSSASGQQRNLYWLVPSDTPNNHGSSCNASVSPAKIQSVTDVRWMMFTPCDVMISSNVGSSSAPVVGAVYGGGAVDLEKLELRVAPMNVPGLSGGGVSTRTVPSPSAPNPAQSSTPSTPSTTPPAQAGGGGTAVGGWVLTDVRDVSRA